MQLAIDVTLVVCAMAFELAHIAMARHALHAGLPVFAMRPSDTRRDLINAYPGNGLAGLAEFGQFDDGRLSLAMLAWQAMKVPSPGRSSDCRGRIRVARLALQFQSEVSLVAVRNGLLRRGTRSEIVQHFLLGWRSRRLLRSRAAADQKQKRKYNSREHGQNIPGVLHDETPCGAQSPHTRAFENPALGNPAAADAR